jgi:hypothetical protein
MHRFVTLPVLLAFLAAPLLPLPALAQGEAKTTISPEKRAYMVQARDRMLDYWQPPDVDSDVRLSIYFRVDRDGKVSKIDIKTLGDSKAEAAEQAAREAIIRAQPFAAVPGTVDPFYVDVRFPLRIDAKTVPTPTCLPVSVFIVASGDAQTAVNNALKRFAEILKERDIRSDVITVVDSRDKASVVIEGSTDPKLPRIEKTGFVGDYKINTANTVGTARLGLKDKSGTDLSVKQLTENTLQLLGRIFGLPGLSDADSIMSSSRFDARLNEDQTRLVSELVKQANCPADQLKGGFVVRGGDEKK